MKGKVFEASVRSKLDDLREKIGREDYGAYGIEELSTVIKEQIKAYSQESEFEEVGVVLTVGDGIARIYGLDNVMNGELLRFSNGEFGMALNLEESVVGAVILGSDRGIEEGDLVKLTGRMMEVPVGDAMSGRIVNALGQPIDNLGEIVADKHLPIERQAPTVIMRREVNRSLETGLKTIDALVPIGKGQRELIVGDRQTGKTAIAIDTILNQKGKNVRCVYVAIGQKSSTVARIQSRLREQGAMDYTTIVFSSASDSSPLQYIAPYAGCSIAEYWMEKGEDVLIVYDDLSKHAVAYRTISLLLGRPPGREAYPGDVFFLHSRLLERAANMAERYGGGSLTALPIVETQEGDISAYIPTNVISITDGQIFLEANLFNNGFRPAINPGLSVSRVGGSAQHPAMQKLAGPLRIEYAQFNELAAFAQFGSDLNPETQAQLNHGERIREVLKQPQYEPLDVSHQIMILHALTQGCMESVGINQIGTFQHALIHMAQKRDRELTREIREAGSLTDDLRRRIDLLVEALKEEKFSPLLTSSPEEEPGL
ncbi:MAG: F0F1 ATP synthase subunit alpha [Fretibacterium sp.]|nr:F0F1 ATP synthase subunit alpha [Fretibacterium sp.]